MVFNPVLFNPVYNPNTIFCWNVFPPFKIIFINRRYSEFTVLQNWGVERIGVLFVASTFKAKQQASGYVRTENIALIFYYSSLCLVGTTRISGKVLQVSWILAQTAWIHRVLTMKCGISQCFISVRKLFVVLRLLIAFSFHSTWLMFSIDDHLRSKFWLTLWLPRYFIYPWKKLLCLCVIGFSNIQILEPESF